MWQGWVDIIIGIWLILCGFIPALQTPPSMLIAGVAAAIFGFWSKTWQGTTNGIIGFWLFFSGVWFGLVAPWNFFISGGIMTILAVWNATKHPHVQHMPAQ